jgi:hypothetical protein
MRETKYTLEIPVEKPLKEKEKVALIDELSSTFESLLCSDVVFGDVHYMEKRGATEALSLILNFVIATAEIIGVALAISMFLKSRKSEKEVTLKNNELTISIRGNMTNKEIIDLIKAGGRVAEKKHPGKH